MKRDDLNKKTIDLAAAIRHLDEILFTSPWPVLANRMADLDALADKIKQIQNKRLIHIHIKPRGSSGDYSYAHYVDENGHSKTTYLGPHIPPHTRGRFIRQVEDDEPHEWDFIVNDRKLAAMKRAGTDHHIFGHRLTADEFAQFYGVGLHEDKLGRPRHIQYNHTAFFAALEKWRDEYAAAISEIGKHAEMAHPTGIKRLESLMADGYRIAK